MITAVLALYLNFLVLIVQSFEKIPALHALAPTQSDPRSRSRSWLLWCFSWRWERAPR